MLKDTILTLTDIMQFDDVLITKSGSLIPVFGYAGQPVRVAVNENSDFVQCRRPPKKEEFATTAPNSPMREIALCLLYVAIDADYIHARTANSKVIERLYAVLAQLPA